MDNTVVSLRLTYRAFAVNEHGRLGGVPRIIEAFDDADAARQAETFGARQPLELWEGARLVGRLRERRAMPVSPSMVTAHH